MARLRRMRRLIANMIAGSRLLDPLVNALMRPFYGPVVTNDVEAQAAIAEAHEMSGTLNGQVLGLLPILVGLSAVIGVAVLTDSSAVFWLVVAPAIASLTFAIWSCLRALMIVPTASRFARPVPPAFYSEIRQLQLKLEYVRIGTASCLPAGFFIAMAALLTIT